MSHARRFLPRRHWRGCAGADGQRRWPLQCRPCGHRDWSGRLRFRSCRNKPVRLGGLHGKRSRLLRHLDGQARRFWRRWHSRAVHLIGAGCRRAGRLRKRPRCAECHEHRDGEHYRRALSKYDHALGSPFGRSLAAMAHVAFSINPERTLALAGFHRLRLSIEKSGGVQKITCSTSGPDSGYSPMSRAVPDVRRGFRRAGEPLGLPI